VLQIAGAFLALLILLGSVSLYVLQTPWFSDFARTSLITALSNSTGAKVEIAGLRFEALHLRLHITGLVIHGTEARTESPLAQASSLELRLKLFAGLSKLIDLAYLGIDTPRINIIVNADGSTNIPEPKVKSTSGSKSPLDTVVDLAVGQFRVEHGLIAYAQRKLPVNLHGDNLRIALDFNAVRSVYQGFVKVDALKVSANGNSPLLVHVSLPLEIRRDGISLKKAQLDTESSHLLMSASLDNLTSPKLAVRTNGTIFLPEMARVLDLPIATNDRVSPSLLALNLETQFDQKANTIALQHFRLALGKTTLEASGTANPAKGDTIKFSGDVALAEITRLLNVASPQISGYLALNGNAGFDREKHYGVHGTITSRALFIADGSAKFSNVSLSTPFQIASNLISLDSLHLAMLGGDLSARVSFLDMSKLSAAGRLHNISLGALCSALEGRTVGYGGLISGGFAAKDDLQTGGRSVVNASARLSIMPSSHGVPVKGLIDAKYASRDGLVDLQNAYISLPASRISLSGSLNKVLTVSLISQSLNDFLPLTRFAKSNAAGAFPAILNGGMLKVDANVQGNLSAPRISGHAGITKFVAQGRTFDDLSLDFAGSPEGVRVQNGKLRRDRMQVAFDGSLSSLVGWKPVSRSEILSNVTIRSADLGDLFALAGESTSANRGGLQADVHIGGTYGDPLGSLSAQLSQGTALGQPFDSASAQVSLTHGLITLNALELDMAGGKIALKGRFQHPADRFTAGDAAVHLQTTGVNLSQIETLRRENAGVQGVVTLTVDVAAELHDQQGKNRIDISNVNADCSVGRLRIRNQDAGSLTVKAQTSSGEVVYTAHSNFAGSSINVEGHTRLTADYRTSARAVIRNLPTQNTLEVVGQSDVPITGLLTADAAINGDLASPDATVDLELTKASIYQEAVNRLTAKIHYRNDLLDLPQLDIVAPAGTVNLSGRYAHPNGTKTGTLRFRVNSSDLDAAKSKRIQQFEPGVSGKLRLEVDLAANVSDIGGRTDLQLSTLNADVLASEVSLNNLKMGGLNLSARTNQSNVTFHLDSDLAQSEIHASGTSQLSENYPTRAEVTFKNVRYENIIPIVEQDSETQVPLHALVEGKASVDGPVLNAKLLAASVELSRLEITSTQRRSASVRAISLQNDQPVVATLDKGVLTVQRFAIRGPETSLDVTGSVDIANPQNALRLNLMGNLDLGILQQMDRDFYSSGTVALEASVAGTLNKPVLGGQIALRNANVNYANAPNGISGANGVILLSGNTAVVKNLTAQSGGGKIEISGSVGLSLGTAVYNLRAKATHVLTRYDNAGVTSSATLALTGNSRRSILSGRINIERLAYSSSSDIGSLLYSASSPPSTPNEPSPLLAGMRLDINITTASDLRVSSTYVEQLEVNSNLSVRGTAAEPGIIGHLNITNGQLVFFGNTYTVNTGSINFYDASSIRPELNLSLETVAQGVDVTLSVKGPISNMKLTYRSDPPLTFDQIVQLLAMNTTPFDPTIAAHQPPAPSQSLSQMGESQVLGQAVANPLASRMQRVFGLSEFKIDPAIAGNNGQPTARVTLSQKITNNLTFTYINDVTQTNSEIVRVQWDLSSKTSAVALRDYNGNVSVQLFYKFQIR
jgi:translocation and assembly module TamB